jgi:hypothetical protein
MELGYEDFPEDGTRVRASLLPFDGDRFSRAQKLFRIGSVTAACVGALAIVGLLSSPANKAAPEWVDAKVEAPTAPAVSRHTTTSLAKTESKISSGTGRLLTRGFTSVAAGQSGLPDLRHGTRRRPWCSARTHVPEPRRRRASP